MATQLHKRCKLECKSILRITEKKLRNFLTCNVQTIIKYIEKEQVSKLASMERPSHIPFDAQSSRRRYNR